MTISSSASERSASALLDAPSIALRSRPDAPDSLVSTVSRSPPISKTAAARMSVAIAARVTDPSPPKQRSRAPKRSVFPAPVSPVSTLKPGPNSRRASWITPRPWAYNSNSVDLGMSLSEAFMESCRQVEAASGDDPHRHGALAHLDELTDSQRPDVATVGDDDRRLVLGDQADHLVVGDDDGPVDRKVWRDRRQDHHRQRRFDHRAAGREVVTRAAGRGGDHDPIGGVGEVFVVVHVRLQSHHVTGVSTLDDHFVESELLDTAPGDRD